MNGTFDIQINPCARTFAREKHGDQMYGPHPYGAHLEDVANVLRDFGIFDEVMLNAAYLHDVLEDTDTKTEELLGFHPDTIRIVLRLTKEKGLSRTESNLEVYGRIRLCPKATTVKLADRIANVRASAGDYSKFLKMYRTEYSSFKDALQAFYYSSGKKRISHAAMWAELDRLLLN